MRSFACPITKDFFEYPDNCIFKVYARKSNSIKKLIYVGTDVNKAWKYYLSIKLFKKDYRYLVFTLPYSSDEQSLKRASGTDPRPLNKKISRASKYPKLKGCSFGPIRDVPPSLVAELKTYCQSVLIGEKRIIELLLSEFLSKPVDARGQILVECQRLLDAYLLQDGGERIQEYLERREDLKAIREEENNKHEDDLL